MPEPRPSGSATPASAHRRQPVTVSGDTLDIRGDKPVNGEPPEDFVHGGTFSFTGGKFKVKQDGTVLIE